MNLMSHKTVHTVAGVIFGIAALFHLIRLINNWPVTLGPYTVPAWPSIVGLVIGGYLCIRLLQDNIHHK